MIWPLNICSFPAQNQGKITSSTHAYSLKFIFHLSHTVESQCKVDYKAALTFKENWTLSKSQSHWVLNQRPFWLLFIGHWWSQGLKQAWPPLAGLGQLPGARLNTSLAGLSQLQLHSAQCRLWHSSSPSVSWLPWWLLAPCNVPS